MPAQSSTGFLSSKPSLWSNVIQSLIAPENILIISSLRRRSKVQAKNLLIAVMAGAFLTTGFAQNPAEQAAASTYEAKLKPVFQEWERADRL